MSESYGWGFGPCGTLRSSDEDMIARAVAKGIELSDRRREEEARQRALADNELQIKLLKAQLSADQEMKDIASEADLKYKEQRKRYGLFW